MGDPHEAITNRTADAASSSESALLDSAWPCRVPAFLMPPGVASSSRLLFHPACCCSDKRQLPSSRPNLLPSALAHRPMPHDNNP